jgi:branched-chain amino acid transport system substrate-binding protein
MEAKTKKILAVVVIAIVATGVGLGVWYLLPQPYEAVVTGQLRTPGMPSGVPADHILIVGILDPMTEIQGEGAWKGAFLACEELNKAGGVNISDETYYFGIIAEDTHEADPSYVISKGNTAAQKIIADDHARYIIGGFRTEMLMAYREIIMDEKMLFLGTGAATDDFCKNVTQNYARYQYWFRIMPINSTSLGGEIAKYFVYLKSYLQSPIGFNKTVKKFAIIREDLDWTVSTRNFLAYYLTQNKTSTNMTLVADIAYPADAGAAEFQTYWQQIDAAGAQITIPIISAQGGIIMTTQYAALHPGCIIAGIDVMAQTSGYWADTGGACRYETILQALTETNKTTKTLSFYNNFTTKFGEDPLYTAAGSYDAMYLIRNAIDEAQSLNSTDLVEALELISPTDTWEGCAGNLGFTPSHDLFEGYRSGKLYSCTLFAQWQAGGAKECVSSGNLVYPDSIVTAPLELPPWAMN